MWRALGVLTVFAGAPAWAAGELLTDDFEDGGLLKPNGAWDTLDLKPGVDAGRLASAAHSGGFGFCVDDVGATPGPADQTALYSSVVGVGLRASVRAWLRVSASNDLGRISPIELLSTLVDQRAFCDISLAQPGNLVVLAVDDASGANLEVDAGVRLTTGKWHLFECEVSGLSTGAGFVSLSIDGVQVATTAASFTGASIGSVAVGMPFADDCAFVGRLDLDDVRVAPVAQAQRVAIDAGSGAIDAGACAPVELTLVTSLGQPAGVPFSSQLLLSAQNGQWFSDALCATPAVTLALGTNQSSAMAWVMALDAGTLSLTAGHADLVSGVIPVAVTGPDAGAPDAGAPDAGSPDAGAPDAGPADAGASDAGALDAGAPDAGEPDGGTAPPSALALTVGCGCGSAPLFWPGLVLALLWRRRAPSRVHQPATARVQGRPPTP